MSAESSPTTGQIAAAVLLDPERRRKLFRYACVQFRINEQDAEDLLQETALELLRYRSYVRSPEGFVFTVFRARCVRFIGTRRAAYTQSSESAGEVSEVCDADANCFEEQVALREALSEISSKCRRLIHAYYLEGQSLKEAARTVALADSSVARTISRCLQKLRECMA
jgi:RNA polymerase sigma factor (sigma-70 family)